MNLLDLVVKISVDDQASKKVDDIGSGIKNGLSGAASAAATGLKVAGAAAAAAGAATVAFGKTALDAYSNYEQLVGGVDTLFKDASGKLQQYAAQAFATAGTSANQYMQIATSFSASLIQGLGGDTQAAVEYANTAITDMSDNANKMGTSIDLIQESYQSLARGNYAMLDNLKLGYGGTKAELERMVEDANAYKESIGGVGDLTVDNFADVIEAIHLTQEQLGITGTTAEEAATTIEGSVNQMKAAWDNWVTGLGDEDADMEALTDNLVSSIQTAASNVIPRLGEIFSTLFSTIGEQLPGAASYLGENLVPMLQGAFDTAFQVLTEYMPQLFSNLWTGLKDQLPEGVVALVETMVSSFQTAFENMKGLFEENVAPLLEKLNEVIGPFLEEYGPAIEWIAGLVGGVLMTAVSLFLGVLTTVIEALTLFKQKLDEFGQWISELPTKIGDMVNSIGQFFSDLGSKISTALSDAVNAVSQFVSDVGSWFAGIPSAIGGALSQAVSAVQSWASNIATQAQQAGQQFVSAVQQKFNEAVSFVQSIPGKITGALGNLGSLLYSAGSDLINGLKNGIMGAIDGVVSAVQDGVQKVVDAAKGLLGIASPSKVFIEIGEYVSEGFAQGITNKMGRAVDSVNTMMESVNWAALDEMRAYGQKLADIEDDEAANDYGDFLLGIADAADEVKRSALGLSAASRIFSRAGLRFSKDFMQEIIEGSSDYEEYLGRMAEWTDEELQAVADAYSASKVVERTREFAASLLDSDGLSEALEQAGVDLYDFAEQLANTGIEADDVNDTIQDFADTVSDFADQVADGFDAMGTDSQTGLREFTSNLQNNIIEAQKWQQNVDRVFSQIGDFPGADRFREEVLEGGYDKYGKLLEDMANATNYEIYNTLQLFDMALQYGQRAGTNVMESILDVANMDEYEQMGFDIVKGLADGIMSGESEAVSAIRQVCESIAASIRSSFGIASPSKLFRRFGKYTMDGMALGIEDGLSLVKGTMERAMGDISNMMVDTSSAVKSLTGINGGGTIGSRKEENNYYFYNPVKTPYETARAIRMQRKYGLAGAR